MLLLFQCVQHLTLTKLYGLSHCIRLAIDASPLSIIKVMILVLNLFLWYMFGRVITLYNDIMSL